FLGRHTTPPNIFSLTLHDALPILPHSCTATASGCFIPKGWGKTRCRANKWPTIFFKEDWGFPTEIIISIRMPAPPKYAKPILPRSEEHTSELQSRENLVCRLLLEK